MVCDGCCSAPWASPTIGAGLGDGPRVNPLLDRHRQEAAADPGSDRIDASIAGAILTIDIAALRANYRLLRARLDGAACAAVVKADAYGLGADRVCAALRKEGCEAFFVAHLSEALALRRRLDRKASVYVLNGLPPGAEMACAAAEIVPVLNSRQQIDSWRGAAKLSGRSLPAAVQIDTGMARLGLAPEDVAALSEDSRAFAGIDTRLVMSHLARADEPGEPASETQRRTFDRLSAMLPQARRSLANSSGIFLGSAFHYDLARPGAALYGINPVPGRTNPMKPVVTLQARVIQTRSVPAGTGIGYGHTHIAATPMRLATIALGYADGWQRHGRSGAFVQGQRLPFAGSVSMDTTILDITDLPAGMARPGDLVDLIGGHQDVDDVARQLGTIGYEVLTSLGSRFHRVYRDE